MAAGNVILIHIFLGTIQEVICNQTRWRDYTLKVTLVHTLLDFLFNHMQYYSNHDPSAVLFPPYL